jgi:DNA-binding MarR family transcriptional regulator
MARASKKADEQLPVIPEALSHSIGYLLNFNGRIIRERLEEALKPLNLSLRELGVMRILENEGPLSQHVLARRHNIDRTTTVQIIDQLEERQLVIRSTNQADRRSNLLFLTPRGRKTLSRALKLVNKEQNIFLQALDEKEKSELFELLYKLLSYNLTNFVVTPHPSDPEPRAELKSENPS